MIALEPTIARIEALLKEDTFSSCTYAALEARLAIERVCYDRLRQRHDYISINDIQRWQPGPLINILMLDVDPHVAETVELSIATTPTEKFEKPEDKEYTKPWVQYGFDARKLARVWQALSKVALHAKLPTSRSDEISDYGDKEIVRKKVNEALIELEKLASSTMAYSGSGREVYVRM